MANFNCRGDRIVKKKKREGKQDQIKGTRLKEVMQKDPKTEIKCYVSGNLKLW